MHKSTEVQIGNVKLGGENPIVIQSMTNTDTSNPKETFEQIKKLVNAGSEMVRVTIMDEKGAQAIPKIKKLMIDNDCNVPLIGDFHFIGHELLKKYPECAACLDKYRINPGNVGKGSKQSENFSKIVKIAIKNNKVVRIGVNAGSLDQELLDKMMEENNVKPRLIAAQQESHPKSDKEIFREVMVTSAINSVEEAIKLGLPKNKIVVSVKVSDVQDVIYCYESLASKVDYCLHVGLTEAGGGDKGTVATSAALGILLQKGIGDTIRVSITPEPGKSRTKEVEIAKLILQTMGFRDFKPVVTSCPGCGRTSSTLFQTIAKETRNHIDSNINEWLKKYKGIEKLKIAVMGCVVNGPGESRHADIGISLPGKMEKPFAPIIIEGKQAQILRGDNISKQFLKVLDEYIYNRFSK